MLSKSKYFLNFCINKSGKMNSSLLLIAYLNFADLDGGFLLISFLEGIPDDTLVFAIGNQVGAGQSILEKTITQTFYPRMMAIAIMTAELLTKFWGKSWSAEGEGLNAPRVNLSCVTTFAPRCSAFTIRANTLSYVT